MYKFDKFPTKIDKMEYINQEKKLVDFIKLNKNIISLYSIGELELLGVSDLDYLIIFKNTINKNNILKSIKDCFLIDTILFLNINEIKNINYISHHFNYKLIFGENLNIHFDIKNKNLNIIYAWKVCFFSLLRNFYYYKFNNKILVKNLLSQINDIRYPIFFLKNLGIEKKEYNDFLINFSKYRSEYFNHEKYDNLPIYLEKVIKLSWNIVFDLNKFLPNKKIGYCYGRFPTIFLNFIDFNDNILKTEEKLNKIGKISRFLILPTGFNFKGWDGSLKNDLEKIILNNKTFLNFGLDGFIFNIALVIKKIFDFITFRIFK